MKIPEMEERIQKILAQAGVASRRAAEMMILEGRVSINGATVDHLGQKADPDKDEIRLDGKLILCDAQKVYLMLNKPRGYVTTLHDPEGRPTVKDLVSDIGERVFPVGRLDYDSEGMLIMTNDGHFAQKLQHPRFQAAKTYRVKIKGRLSKDDMRRLEKGIALTDGLFRPVEIQYEKANDKSSWLKLSICEGRNRVVRRAFDSLHHPVARLIRVAIANLPLGNLKAGSYRALNKKERERLME